jgi:sec-independent protein translocase protein TatA
MNIGWQEILFILLIALLLFGAKRIPDLARNLGKGLREFKKGLKDIEAPEEKKKDTKEEERTEEKNNSTSKE